MISTIRSSATLFLQITLKVFENLSLRIGRWYQSSTNKYELCQSDVPPKILEVLPQELILYMAQFMPLSSRILFTLSCRTTYAILGTRYWTRLWDKDQHQQHIDFLSLLSKELPSYVPCYHCRVLHLCRALPSRNILRARPYYLYDSTACHKAELKGRVGKYLHENFQFRTFQMAMKNYRLGLDYEVWLECLEYTFEGDILMQKLGSDFTARVRIVDNSLLYQSQRVIQLPHEFEILNLDRWSFYVCPHITLGSGGISGSFPVTATCALDHRHDLERCVRKSGIKTCPVCLTEYEITLQECRDFGTMAITTKWIDLGEGQTILDPKWLSHLSNKYPGSDTSSEVDSVNGRRLVDGVLVHSKCISIRDLFRQGRSSELDSMISLETARRLFYLPKISARRQ
jgi:hypothetical protein